MFKRFYLATLLALVPALALAQSQEGATDAPSETPIPKFDGDTNDAAALRKYAGEIFGEVAGLLRAEKTDQAEAKIDALDEFAQQLEPTNEDAKTTKDRMASAIRFFRERIKLARVSVEDLKKSLKEKADGETVQQYLMKLGQRLSSLASSDPKKAEKELAAAKEFLEGVAENSASDEEIQRAVRLGNRLFNQLEEMIEDEKKLVELIGKDAAPLAPHITAWVNGQPLTQEDLEGKVVLLDFWAVWCGPCIATFPHLRQWHEEYSDDGLVIIGLTRYYDMKWDEEAGRATRSTDEVPAEDEQAMLKKFAEEHNLEHVFAVQEDRTLSDFYAVSGIPHVVLIDREGKVRLVKVGAGEENAEEIGQMIEELIAG